MFLLMILQVWASQDFFLRVKKGNDLARSFEEGFYSQDIFVSLPKKNELYTIKAFVTEAWFDRDVPKTGAEFLQFAEPQMKEVVRILQQKNLCPKNDVLLQAAQLTAIFRVSPDRSGNYFSLYGGSMEPWELLVYSGGKEVEEEFRVADTFSAALAVLLVLKEEGKLIRYASSKSSRGTVYGVFIPNKQQKGMGIPFKSGTIFPMADALDPGTRIRSGQLWSLDKALEFAFDNSVVPDTITDEESGEEPAPALPPIQADKPRPDRKILKVTVEQGIAWFWVGGIGAVLIFAGVSIKRRNARIIARAKEERERREKNRQF